LFSWQEPTNRADDCVTDLGLFKPQSRNAIKCSCPITSFLPFLVDQLIQCTNARTRPLAVFTISVYRVRAQSAARSIQAFCCENGFLPSNASAMQNLVNVLENATNQRKPGSYSPLFHFIVFCRFVVQCISFCPRFLAMWPICLQ